MKNDYAKAIPDFLIVTDTYKGKGDIYMSVCFEAVLEGQIEEFAYTFPTLAQWKRFVKETRNMAIIEGMDEESFDIMVTILTMDGLPDDFAYLRDSADVKRREEYQAKLKAKKRDNQLL